MRTPCLHVCRINEGLCQGCMRTLGEIQNWRYYSDAERDHIMDDVLLNRMLTQKKPLPELESFEKDH